MRNYGGVVGIENELTGEVIKGEQRKKPDHSHDLAFRIWYQRPDSNRHAFKGAGF